jgi:hypothetical protein
MGSRLPGIPYLPIITVVALGALLITTIGSVPTKGRLTLHEVFHLD